MDVRRFPSRQDAESGNPLEPLSRELLLPRGKGPFFWLLFFGPLQRKVTRLRSEWKLCREASQITPPTEARRKVTRP